MIVKHSGKKEGLNVLRVRNDEAKAKKSFKKTLKKF
jgi:hypothetical protein